MSFFGDVSNRRVVEFEFYGWPRKRFTGFGEILANLEAYFAVRVVARQDRVVVVHGMFG